MYWEDRQQQWWTTNEITDVPCIVDFKIRYKMGIKYDKVKYSTVIKYRSFILLKDTDKQFNSFVMNFIDCNS